MLGCPGVGPGWWAEPEPASTASTYFQPTEWAFEAWGYYDGILPPEWQNLSEDERADWKNAAGTGPYRIADIQTGRQQVYEKNDNYWDTTTIDGEEWDLDAEGGDLDDSGHAECRGSGGLMHFLRIFWIFM